MINYHREITIINIILCYMDDDMTVGDALLALEDGEFLASLNLSDEDTEEINDIYARLEDYRLNDSFDAVSALEDIENVIEDENTPVYPVSTATWISDDDQ